jgi:glycosyltransferase involved in cell wall biosynthesis
MTRPVVSESLEPRVFIVLAAYNESSIVRSVVTRLRQRYAHVVVVDDGSTDGTTGCLPGTGVYLLKHTINRGQGAALQTGITFALTRAADIVVTFDADGQHDEQEIEAMIGPIVLGQCDVTLGSRFLGRAIALPTARLLVLKMGILFTRLVTRIRVTDTHNGLRAFSRKAAEGLKITADRMGHASEILEQIKIAGWRFCEVPVTITYSQYSLTHGQSSWNAIALAAQLLFKKVSQ